MFSLCWQPACCRHSWADLAADQILLRCTFRLHLKHFPAMNSATELIWKRKSPFQTRGKTILIILSKLFYSLKRQARINRSRWRRPGSAHEQSTSHTKVKFILYPVRTFPLFDVRPWLPDCFRVHLWLHPNLQFSVNCQILQSIYCPTGTAEPSGGMVFAIFEHSSGDIDDCLTL